MNDDNNFEKLDCKPMLDCACRVGSRCKYFAFEGTEKPECKDPYFNTKEVNK